MIWEPRWIELLVGVRWAESGTEGPASLSHAFKEHLCRTHMLLFSNLSLRVGLLCQPAARKEHVRVRQHHSKKPQQELPYMEWPCHTLHSSAWHLEGSVCSAETQIAGQPYFCGLPDRESASSTLHSTVRNYISWQEDEIAAPCPSGLMTSEPREATQRQEKM